MDTFGHARTITNPQQAQHTLTRISSTATGAVLITTDEFWQISFDRTPPVRLRNVRDTALLQACKVTRDRMPLHIEDAERRHDIERATPSSKLQHQDAQTPRGPAAMRAVSV